MTPAEFESELATSKFITDRIRTAVPEYQRFWAWEPGNMCCLHIALDDGNLEDEHVEFCLNAAERNDHAECICMANVLHDLSETERLLLEWVVGLWEESLRDSRDPRWLAKYPGALP